MRPVLSVAEMRRVDAEATTDVDLLMDQAGYAVALAAADLGAGYGSKVVVLCGKGNNGGDGYIAAGYLATRGATVVVMAVGQPAPNTPASRAVDRARRNGVRIEAIGVPQPCDYVIDAVVGTGFVGELGADVAAWVDTGALVVAVDIPSGLDGDTGEARGAVFDADITVAFHALKPGHLLGSGPDRCGEVRVVDIGLDGGEPTMELFEDSDVLVPVRPRAAHKWSSGAVATVGGATGLTGAALFAARAALGAGAGVSNLVTTPSTADAYLGAVPGIPTIEVAAIDTAEDAVGLLKRLARFDALIVGPGLEPASKAFVDALITECSAALVVDAGALNVLSLDRLKGRTGLTVLTPHAGEFTRLTGAIASHASAVQLARESGAIVVLKGNPTLIVGDHTIVVASGGPELATIGTGDVLAGMIAAFVARTDDPLNAVASAAHLHGIAGGIAADVTTVTASELLELIGPTVAAFAT